MYTITNTAQTLGNSLSDVIVRVVGILPNVVMAILMLVIGFIVAGILGRAAAHLISLLKIDNALQAAGLNKMLNGVKFSVASFLGSVIKWMILIGFLVAATNIVHLDSFAGILWVMLSYIPNVIVAALILVASFLLGDFVSKLVSGSAKAAGVNSGVAGVAARYAVITVGILAALSQLKIAGGFMDILFAGIVASLSLALGLAFGLGGRDAAARAIERAEKSM